MEFGSTQYSGMNKFRHGWFTEVDSVSPDQALSMAIDTVYHEEDSKYQNILVFESKLFGRVLVLDNAIQCSEKDEFSYQEMLAFLPLNCHPNPKKVLIIGGGDGGVAREVVKHPCVESVVQCEIDERVIEVSKKYLPFMAEGFKSPKLTLHIGDGFEYVQSHQNEFDVIITDSSDPKGPAECLFQKPYYEAVKSALTPAGIVCSQGESFWFTLPLVRDMTKMCRTLFPVVGYASTYVPTYPGGQIGFFLCSKSKDSNFQDPCHKFTEEEADNMNLKYYSYAMHQAAFVLPLFVEKALNGVP